MKRHILTGFGFGPIQSGLFAAEAFKSKNFDKIVIAEIDKSLVDAVRANGGKYAVNVAHADGVKVEHIENIEILNPTDETDRKTLVEYLAKSTEIVTSLPSVNFYTLGDNSVAALIAQGLTDSSEPATIIYAAENNNYAAEVLQEKVSEQDHEFDKSKVQFLNTVIGKMSQVVKEPALIEKLDLKPITPDIERAFLVEAFNHILVTRTKLPNFSPGIKVFVEKENLIPFEEAKLYGHNAIHATLAYLGAFKGYETMTQLKDDPSVMKIGTDAFLNESGKALIKKYSSLGDPLFTETGYRDFAEDLLERMTNPYLQDTIARAGRDPVRKLGLNDRIFGTMQLALEQDVKPENLALGAMAGITQILKNPREYDMPSELTCPDYKILTDEQIEKILLWLWQNQDSKHKQKIIQLVQNAKDQLSKI